MPGDSAKDTRFLAYPPPCMIPPPLPPILPYALAYLTLRLFHLSRECPEVLHLPRSRAPSTTSPPRSARWPLATLAAPAKSQRPFPGPPSLTNCLLFTLNDCLLLAHCGLTLLGFSERFLNDERFLNAERLPASYALWLDSAGFHTSARIF